MSVILQLIALVFLFCVVFSGAEQHSKKRVKRAAYDLPSGWEFLIGSVDPSFQCVIDGYYADVFNGCQLYHVCQTVPTAYGTASMSQHTFMCPNQTVFDQSLLVCNHIHDSIPCESSPDFFYLNGGIGDPNVNFLYDEDVNRRNSYLEASAGSRFGDRVSRDIVPALAPPQPANSLPIIESNIDYELGNDYVGDSETGLFEN